MKRYLLAICATALVILAMTVAGCEKLVQLPGSEGQPATTMGFTNDDNAVNGVNGVLARCMQLNGSFANGAMSLFPALSSDELTSIAPNADPMEQFASNNISSSNNNISIIYSTAYISIAQLNVVLEALRSNKLSQPVRDRLTGECLFFRALCFFYMSNLFGDIALTLSTNVDTVAIQARTGTDSVYRQIVRDLQMADSLLPAEYVAVSDEEIARTHPDKWVARALLARVCLYLQRWDEAERMATDVLDRSDLALETDLDKIFLPGSREILWQLLPWNNSINGDAAYFLPRGANVPPSFAITSVLLNAFETGDKRRTAWIGSSGGVNYPRKYKAGMQDKDKECNVVMRLAEQFLVRAEARAQQGRLSEAVADIDILRSRAGLSKIQEGLSQQAVLDVVARERRVELMCEWGHRWLDLKRTGQADAVLSGLKAGWKFTALLYPFPAGELIKDTHLVQNAGY